MSKKLIYLISFVLLLGVLQAVPAEAQSVVFEFGGTVTSVNPGHWGCDPPWDQVSVGNEWSIVYTFGSTTPDTDGASNHGWYAAITSYTLNVGGNVVYDSGLAGELISIFSNKPVGWDQYEVWISLQNGYMWFMQLDDDTNTAWDTDELPLCCDIELSNFSLRDFTLSDFGSPDGCEISGSVDYHRFTPLEASNPSPADDAIGVDPNVVITWSPGCLAAEHHVYFGLDPGALVLVATKPLGQESYDPPGPLELGTTYYWRINEFNGTDVWEGEVWSFTVGYPFSGLLHTPLGQAQLSSDANGNLVVDNIGSTGQDGVSIALPDDISWFHADWIDLGDPNASEGAILEIVARGIINGEEQVIAIIHREHIMGQVRMDVNFPVLEPEYVEARYYYKGELVLTEEIEHGSKFKDWWDSWEINDGGVGFPLVVWITFCKTGGASTTTPNGNVVAQVDKIGITPKDYTGAFDRFTSWSITAADIPRITITNENVQLSCTPSIPGDINGDCSVDFKDFAIMAQHWLEQTMLP